MRKPRDFDAELRALQDKQKSLKTRKVMNLGELVLATCADGLDPEVLAGALLEAVQRAGDSNDTKEAWRRRGEGFFRQERRARSGNGIAGGPAANRDGAAPLPGAAASG